MSPSQGGQTVRGREQRQGKSDLQTSFPRTLTKNAQVSRGGQSGRLPGSDLSTSVTVSFQELADIVKSHKLFWICRISLYQWKKKLLCCEISHQLQLYDTASQRMGWSLLPQALTPAILPRRYSPDRWDERWWLCPTCCYTPGVLTRGYFSSGITPIPSERIWAEILQVMLEEELNKDAKFCPSVSLQLVAFPL